MEIKLNTKTKTIVVLENVNLHELVKAVKSLFKDWKEYSIISDNAWTYYPCYPYWTPSTITFSEGEYTLTTTTDGNTTS